MMPPPPSTTTAPTRGFGWGRWPLAAAIAADIISLSTRSIMSSLMGMHGRGESHPPSPIRTLTVGSGVPPDPPLAGVAGFHRRSGIAPCPEGGLSDFIVPWEGLLGRNAALLARFASPLRLSPPAGRPPPPPPPL